ncbi:hypothetical protein [Streptomyces xanthophaeus]|uniref:hypothetical protein n=1 Tax=Streptomyces xanthophaeus TaxID=67385 RepID=UPI0026480433|nr:hypothetical protein [Streptomyces xanthophaeus]WKD36540.1 hypothetical protein KO717_34470 [Streptomyces xanthophaeus]
MSQQPKITPLFAECASPEAIEIQLKQARATRDRWARHADRLDQLLVTRRAQKAAGTWPPRNEPSEQPC